MHSGAISFFPTSLVHHQYVPFVYVQTQDDVSKLQAALADQLPQERQRKQQRLQAITEMLEAPASAEVLNSLHAPYELRF